MKSPSRDKTRCQVGKREEFMVDPEITQRHEKSKIWRGFYMGGGRSGGFCKRCHEQADPVPLILTAHTHPHTHTHTTHPNASAKALNPKVAIIYGMTGFPIPIANLSHTRDPMNRLVFGNLDTIEFRGPSLDRAKSAS